MMTSTTSWTRSRRAWRLPPMRTRQKHAARIFNNAFSVDSFFYNHTEGVALCSDSHTSNNSTLADTSAGFDNKITTALSATALAAARIQFRNFRDDRGNRYDAMPDEIMIPPDLYDVAAEIVQSTGKPDTAENNINVHKGAYNIDRMELPDGHQQLVPDGFRHPQAAPALGGSRPAGIRLSPRIWTPSSPNGARTCAIPTPGMIGAGAWGRRFRNANGYFNGQTRNLTPVSAGKDSAQPGGKSAGMSMKPGFNTSAPGKSQPKDRSGGVKKIKAYPSSDGL
jgi:hypothetical protein